MNQEQTAECKECHEYIPVDVYDAIDALYGSGNLRTERLEREILKIIKAKDSPTTDKEKRDVAKWAIEEWLDCKLSAMVDAVEHYELDKDSFWCENCEERTPDTEIKTHNDAMLCTDCYNTATATPRNEEGKTT